MNINLLKPSKIKNDNQLLMMEYGIIHIINNGTRPSSDTCIAHVFIKTKS